MTTIDFRPIINQSVLDQIADGVRRAAHIGGSPVVQLTTPTGTRAYINLLNETQTVDSLSNQYYTLPADCYGNVLTLDQAIDVVVRERQRQDILHGSNKEQSLPGFLLIMRRTLEQATAMWETGQPDCLTKVKQLAATAVACVQRYGEYGNAISTNDVPTRGDTDVGVQLVNGPYVSL